MKPIIPNALLILVLCISAGCYSVCQKGALTLAYRAMQKGKYEHALYKLSQAEDYAPPSPSMAAEISFLRAQCYDHADRIAEAIDAYAYVSENFRDSAYGPQAQERVKALKRSTGKVAAPGSASE